MTLNESVSMETNWGS